MTKEGKNGMAGNRRQELKSLFGGGLSSAEPARAPETKSVPATENPAGAAETPRASSGAVKAMGLSLNAMSREVEEARALRQAISDGERIVTIDPAKIDASFVEDRLSIDGRDDEDFATLMDSIRDSGQQVPILLRPHPDKPGRYQTAYGHRRVRAASRLGIEVRAVVRQLSDDDLILAQGKENAERRNLSFIERGIFARNLEMRGFDRKVIGDALAVQKSELSRLIAVVESVPERFIRHIGPAPKVGRDRWMKLGEFLSKEAREHTATDVVYSEKFKAADSDTRFQILFARLSAHVKPEPVKPDELKDADGRIFARLSREGKAPKIEFAADVDPAFVDEAALLLAERYKQFMAKRRT